MSAIKTEPDSDSEKQSATLKGDFEFVAVKYENDPLEDTHNVLAMKDGLRELTTVKPDVEGEVTTEEHEVCVRSEAQQTGFQGNFNCKGIYSSSYNVCIDRQQEGGSADVSTEEEFIAGTSLEIKNRVDFKENTCEVKSSDCETSIIRIRHDSSACTKLDPHICELCTKAFFFKSRLEKHMRIHTGEKPYNCKECNKSFSQKVTLTNHLRMHTGEKPYFCEDCNKHFSQKISLVNHLRIHTGDIPYTCDLCGKIFSLRSYLVKHIRSHTEKKMFHCTVCKKSFIQRSILTNHLRIHNAEKPYKCSICPEAFSKRQHMNRHISSHTGEKPYMCEICNMEFFGADKMIDKVIHHIHSHPGRINYKI